MRGCCRQKVRVTPAVTPQPQALNSASAPVSGGRWTRVTAQPTTPGVTLQGWTSGQQSRCAKPGNMPRCGGQPPGALPTPMPQRQPASAGPTLLLPGAQAVSRRSWGLVRSTSFLFVVRLCCVALFIFHLVRYSRPDVGAFEQDSLSD